MIEYRGRFDFFGISYQDWEELFTLLPESAEPVWPILPPERIPGELLSMDILDTRFWNGKWLLMARGAHVRGLVPFRCIMDTRRARVLALCGLRGKLALARNLL